MSNIIEQYRKPLASDETGKAIADKLDGKTVEVETRNISEQYRQPLMTEETAREILEKIDVSGGGLPEVTTDDNGKVLSVVAGKWAKAEASGGLPEVTASDNGKVLSVVEGEWAKAESGINVVVIPCTLDSLSAGTLTLPNDMKFEDIKNYVDNGKIVILHTFNNNRYIDFYSTFNYTLLAFGLFDSTSLYVYSVNYLNRLNYNNATSTGKSIALT